MTDLQRKLANLKPTITQQMLDKARAKVGNKKDVDKRPDSGYIRYPSSNDKRTY